MNILGYVQFLKLRWTTLYLFIIIFIYIYIVIIDEQVVVYQQQQKKVLTSYLEEITWFLPINALGTFTMWMQTYHPGYMYMYKHKK